jgi:hypothetical protein
LADRAATLRDPRLQLKNSELPQEMSAMFREAWIYKMRGSAVLVRPVRKGARSFLEQSFDAEKATGQHLMRSIESFKNNLIKKMGKAEKYRSTRRRLR